MSRQQGHVANVLWVLFDHVIESQKQARVGQDMDMETGKHIQINRLQTKTLKLNFSADFLIFFETELWI